MAKKVMKGKGKKALKTKHGKKCNCKKCKAKREEDY
jgi:hypothetical protein